MTGSYSTIINAIKDEIVKSSSLETLKKFCTDYPADSDNLPAHAFERDRKMGFSKLFNFLMMPRTLSQSVELFRYSNLIDSQYVTKSNVSQRRSLIPWGYFKDTFRRVVRAAYSSVGKVDLLEGHILLAGDGTTFSMPDTPGLRDFFLEGRKTGKSQQALSRGVVLKDVLNDMIVSANVESYGRDEIRLLLDCIGDLPERVLALRPIVLLDRKFCAYTLITELFSKGIGFVIRVKSRFNRKVDDFVASGRRSAVVTLDPSVATVKKLKRLYGTGTRTLGFKVRLERLDSGIVVMTSLLRGTPTSESEIYHMRWDDETTIGFLKNNFQMEIFSGTKINSLFQDFYAKVTMYNFLSAILRQAAELHHGQGRDTGKNTCRINRNVALGILRICLPLMLNRRREFNKILGRMLKGLIRNTVPIIPGRHNPRVFRKIKHSGKYITLTNYARAI